MSEETMGERDALGVAYLSDIRQRFAGVKKSAERAAAQVDDASYFEPLEEDGNSIALLMKHMGGSLASSFTDFLTTDGEKPTRNRDAEFELEAGDTRETILAKWERGWSALSGTLDALRPRDLLGTVHIRGEPHSVVQALSRHVVHQSTHAGQIVILARHWAGESWETLSIPRGKSEEYTARMRERQGK
ncbi:MAG TPA: DUF1572 family protein [Gemmatimonadaceae bacterium]|nr:DUF1572 family protein [Gemmatimonadaceae bacterium]